MGGTGVDVAGYLARIGYGGPTTATAQTLAALIAGHTRHIPFENLDPLLGVPVDDLSPAALTDKLVRRRRGGYCYEHNCLMRDVLVDLGFSVDALGGRVVWMNPAGPAGPPPAQTHQALAVRIPGAAGTPDAPGAEATFLVDVGFGGQTLTAPIRLAAGPIQQTDHGAFRLRAHGPGYVLETLLGEVWQPMYTFTVEPRPLIDLEVGSWYVSTHPRSMFVIGLSAALVTDEARWNLRGRNLVVHYTGGGTERTRLDTAAAVCELLTEQFGIDLAGLPGVEARVAEVLDT